MFGGSVAVLSLVLTAFAVATAAEDVKDAPVSRAPAALRQYATLYAFPPDMCQLREHSAVYDFIDNEATFYHDLEVVYVSMDGDPPVFRFFPDKAARDAATIDADALSTEDLLALIEKYTAREKAGVKMTEEEKGYEVAVKSHTVLEIKELLAQQNVLRGLARPDWSPPTHEPTKAPGFTVPDGIVESGEPEVPIEELDDSIAPGYTEKKRKALEAKEKAAKEAAAAAAAAAGGATGTAAPAAGRKDEL